MFKKEYFLVGATHIDLAWKSSSLEMTEMQEIFIIRLLDALEKNPDFKYLIEQASHFRNLKKTRPDLIERLKVFIKQGRVEMVGGMASTLETNIPNGECFVKNQLMGMKWVKENFDTNIKTGWLIDTFGINAQVPQILNQVGIKKLMANRFGGKHYHDAFVSKGLDGSEILIVGRDGHSAYTEFKNVVFSMYKNWDDLEECLNSADQFEGEGPFLVVPYTENEMIVTLRIMDFIKERNSANDDENWVCGLPHEYFDALEKKKKVWPVVNGDLNPEFTGTFSLRPLIRIVNRKVENLLLEAEKWASILQLKGWKEKLENAWWEMAYNQFHDVFTGSHPTKVFSDLMSRYDKVEQVAQEILDKAFQAVMPMPKFLKDKNKMTVTAFNGLPWHRTDIITIPLKDDFKGVSKIVCNNETIPFEVKDGNIRILTELPATGVSSFIIEKGEEKSLKKQEVASTIIENEYIQLECDNQYGIKRLVLKDSNRTIMKNAGDFLVIQHDEGNFQIEQPASAEVIAAAGKIRVYACETSAIGESVILLGEFPRMFWAGDNSSLIWEAELTLLKGKPRVDVKLTLNWIGEASRIRLKLSTEVKASEGIYEIPFGTVRRKPYSITGNARGEWPAHRFVALEDNVQGIALINNGTVGVEVNGGTLYNTLIRAPKSEYSGMVPDDTSSQRGTHEFEFALMPYEGSWNEALVVKQAQEVNSPVLAHVYEGTIDTIIGMGEVDMSIDTVEKAIFQCSSSYLSINANNVVLSSVKVPEDVKEENNSISGMLKNDTNELVDINHKALPNELVVRLYETAGDSITTKLYLKGAKEAWCSNLKEERLEVILCNNETIEIDMKPFEIKTILVKRG